MHQTNDTCLVIISSLRVKRELPIMIDDGNDDWKNCALVPSSGEVRNQKNWTAADFSLTHFSSSFFIYKKVGPPYNISEPATRPISPYSAYYAGWIRSRKGDSGYNSFRDLFNCCLRPPFFSPYFFLWWACRVPARHTRPVAGSFISRSHVMNKSDLFGYLISSMGRTDSPRRCISNGDLSSYVSSPPSSWRENTYFIFDGDFRIAD